MTSKLSALSRHEALASERRLLRTIGRNAAPFAKMRLAKQAQKATVSVVPQTAAPVPAPPTAGDLLSRP